MIPKAQRLSLEGMAAAIADVAERARAGALEPDEVHGGTFTITNPGQFGAVLATPIINQPQVAILDLEAIVKRPVVVEDDAIAIRPMTYLPMSWDHRALDGATAARFLALDQGPARRLGGRLMAVAVKTQAAAPDARGGRSQSGAPAAATRSSIAIHSTALGPALGGLRDVVVRPTRAMPSGTRCACRRG